MGKKSENKPNNNNTNNNKEKRPENVNAFGPLGKMIRSIGASRTELAANNVETLDFNELFKTEFPLNISRKCIAFALSALPPNSNNDNDHQHHDDDDDSSEKWPSKLCGAGEKSKN